MIGSLTSIPTLSVATDSIIELKMYRRMQSSNRKWPGTGRPIKGHRSSPKATLLQSGMATNFCNSGRLILISAMMFEVDPTGDLCVNEQKLLTNPTAYIPQVMPNICQWRNIPWLVSLPSFKLIQTAVYVRMGVNWQSVNHTTLQPSAKVAVKVCCLHENDGKLPDN